MAESNAQDRQLPASERKRRKAREEGQVARSRDLGHFAALGAAALAFMGAAGWAVDRMFGALRGALRFDQRALAGPGPMAEYLTLMTLEALWVILPLGFLMFAVAVAAAALAGGLNWTFKPLQPQWGKLSPLSGLGRIFSGQQLADTGKASLLVLVLGAIAFFYLRANAPAFMDTLAMPLPAGVLQAARLIGSGVLLVVLALAVFALIDVPWQRFQLSKRLRMSHQEVKEEHKESDGNPEVKSRLKQRMREASRRRMMTAVPQADLVVMNPTHYAVALKYDERVMGAPRVVAKGKDLLALRIRDLAREAKVPVLEAPPLARALYAHTEIDQEVPATLFAAVAQVLAHVYQLREALAGRGPMPSPLAPVTVPVGLDPLQKAAAAAAGA